MADIERKVVELATKARDNKLSPDEMAGGTFTITNGGVFGLTHVHPYYQHTPIGNSRYA